MLLLSTRLRLFIAIISMIAFAVAPARSQTEDSPHSLVRKSIVYIQATFGEGAEEKTVFGTGFVVSEDGFVLTTYDIINQLGGVDPWSVSFKLSIAEKSAPLRQAISVEWRKHLDLLLLKLPPPPDPYKPATVGRAYTHEGDVVYASGFPSGDVSFLKHKGTIEARESEGSVNWSTSIKVQLSESGSPVYDSAGVVIGIVTGSSNGKAIFAPIEFAEILAPVRLAYLERQLRELDSSLRGIGSWKARTDPFPPSARAIRIEHQSLLPTRDHPEIVFIEIDASWTDVNGNKKNVSILSDQEVGRIPKNLSDNVPIVFYEHQLEEKLKLAEERRQIEFESLTVKVWVDKEGLKDVHEETVSLK